MRRPLLATVPALLIALTGCGSPAVTAGSQPSPAATTSAAIPPSPAGTTHPATTKPTTAAPVPCRPSDISASLTVQPATGSSSSVRAMIILTNTGTKACRVTGWPTITLRNAADETVPFKVKNVSQPGPAQPVDIRAEASAFAGMKWVPCDKGDDTCPVGNSLTLTLPGQKTASKTSLSGFPKPEDSDIALSSVQIGPVSPSRQGVVAW